MRGYIDYTSVILSLTLSLVTSRDDYFLFGSVFIKKNNQIEFKKKPKPNRNRFTPTGFGLVRFFWTKTGSNRFDSVFSVWLSFCSVFSGLARFFLFGSVFFVRFGFFGFRLIKPKSNRTGRLFQNFNRFFFHGSVFSIIFFNFFNLIDFLVFLSPSNYV